METVLLFSPQFNDVLTTISDKKLTVSEIEELRSLIVDIAKIKGVNEDKFLCQGHDVFDLIELFTEKQLIRTIQKEKYTSNQLFINFLAFYKGYGYGRKYLQDFLGDILIDFSKSMEI